MRDWHEIADDAVAQLTRDDDGSPRLEPALSQSAAPRVSGTDVPASPAAAAPAAALSGTAPALLPPLPPLPPGPRAAAAAPVEGAHHGGRAEEEPAAGASRATTAGRGSRARHADRRPARALLTTLGGSALAVGGVALGLAALLLLNGDESTDAEGTGTATRTPPGTAGAVGGAAGDSTLSPTGAATAPTTDAVPSTAGPSAGGTAAPAAPVTGDSTGSAPGVVSPRTTPPAATAPRGGSTTAAPVTSAGAGPGTSTSSGSGAASGPDAAAAPARAPLTVLNNSRITGLADRSAQRFRAAGWAVADVGNFTGRIRATTVYYEPGQLAAAEALAARFTGIERVLPRPDNIPGEGLTVVLTKEYAD